MDRPFRLASRIAVSILTGLVFLIMLCPFNARAQDYEGTLNITSSFFNQKFKLSPDSINLLDIRAMAPGDKWTGKVTIHNGCANFMDVALFDVRNELADDTLFNALTLKIKVNGHQIYNGSYNMHKEAPVTDYISVAPGRDMTMDIEVSLPPEVGNEVQGKEMRSSWVFDAKYTPIDPSGPDKKPSSGQSESGASSTIQQSIQTGYDLTSSTSSPQMWFYIGFLTAAAIFLTESRIRKTRNKLK